VQAFADGRVVGDILGIVEREEVGADDRQESRNGQDDDREDRGLKASLVGCGCTSAGWRHHSIAERRRLSRFRSTHGNIV